MKIGDEIRFRPAAFAATVQGFGEELDVYLNGTVVLIHEEHRWYRVEYSTPGCRCGHECFKF